MANININKLKSIIREQVGFERQFINPISCKENAWGMVEEIYFEVKGIYYKITPDQLGGVVIEFADEPEEAEETAEAPEAEETEETTEAPETEEAQNA